MRKMQAIFCLVLCWIMAVHFTDGSSDVRNLRKIYSKSPEHWPKPSVHDTVKWKELGVLPETPINPAHDSVADLVKLGKTLFFDPRLSGSLQISCASCHIPQLSWADGRERSLGHEGQENKRNSPSLHNVWFYKRLFWDGRSHSLEDQAFAPINSESEMHGDMRELPRNLRRVPGYRPMFQKAFGDDYIDPDRIASALAAFQRTIRSADSRFDKFIRGDKDILTDQEIKGLHIFRTKAKCMNCHNGPMFSDNSFHNNGFAGNDIGLYHVTHDENDRGKMKTPSLRDVANTGPWMHDGRQKDLLNIIQEYGQSKPVKGKDPLLTKIKLSQAERLDLLAFLKSISAPPLEFNKPDLPR